MSANIAGQMCFRDRSLPLRIFLAMALGVAPGYLFPIAAPQTGSTSAEIERLSAAAGLRYLRIGPKGSKSLSP